MKVILLHEVKGVGRKDSIVDVAEGYARNFLLPKGFADIATVSTIEKVRQRTTSLGKRKEAEDAEHAALAERLTHVRITIQAAASSKGKLFGSVTASMVQRSLAQQGFAVPEAAISFATPIDHIGNHSATVALTAAHAATITVTVVAETRHA